MIGGTAESAKGVRGRIEGGKRGIYGWLVIRIMGMGD